MTIAPDNVHDTLQKHLIADGFPIIFDLQKSHGSRVIDAVTGTEYIDCYSFFSSLPLGFNHPTFDDPTNRERLLSAALLKPSNSDADTAELATFVDTFAREAMPAPFCHLFFIEGGALAVENALKAAFDWKVRKNMAAGRGELGTRIMHFAQAFHGRSGYTMSVTNTDPVKVQYFPKFDWPRISNPMLQFPVTPKETERVIGEENKAVAEMEAAFDAHPHDIAGIIIEPIQAEGGDHHFRPEFFQRLRQIADAHQALLIFDEVQTGFGTSGKLWAYQNFDVTPDIIAFGKKTQVCGIMAGPRLDEVEDNVFRVSSRINSTWGGGLVDMVRCEIVLEAIKKEHLVENAAAVGAHMLQRLTEIGEEFPDRVSNVRGLGLMCAFDCVDGAARDALQTRAREEGLLLLACGDRSLRARPALTVTMADAEEIHVRLQRAMQ